MRRARSFLIPTALITLYYALFTGVIYLILSNFPGIREWFPIGGIDYLAERDSDSFEAVYSSIEDTVFSPTGALRLALASLGSAILIIPVSWVYFITSRNKKLDQSFVQTIIILPIVVTGISMIVMNSLPLAFSLAGIVAAVRFRFSLDQPADAMYIFVALSVGLASGIGALSIALVISMAFVYATMTIWRLEYGKILSGPFLAMLTRRDRSEEDY